MRRWLAGCRAVAGLTLTEAARQRLWLLLAAAAACLLAAAPGLDAVDDRDRLKLAVVAITGVIGFVVILLAIMVAAGQLRRDLDARTGHLLFAKPLARSAYLLGRWAGLQGGLLAGILLLSLVGTAVIAWQFRGLPAMRQVHGPGAWTAVSAFGELIPVDECRRHLQLAGPPGNGVRWTFTGLPAQAPPAGLEVLLRVRLKSADPEELAEDALAQVLLVRADGGAPRPLALSPGSPYGQPRGGQAGRAGEVVILSRIESRNDLGQDFMRLRLAPEDLGPGGTVTIQLVRLEARSSFIIGRDDSARLAVPGGGFLGNLVRGGLVLLAGASLIAAWTLLCAVVANLGVATLGGLTLFFAGGALPAMREVLTYDEAALPLRRLMELALWVLPDFDRHGVAASLAASEAVGWATVGSAWVYYGGYAALCLVLAWVAMARKEL